MTDFATIVEQATSDHVRSGQADTSAADLRLVFGPIAQALRFFQNLAAGAAILILAGAPDAAAGHNGDVYINSTTTDFYQKSADQWGAPVFQLKGKDGKTPKLGVDYQNGKTPQLGVDYQNGQNGKSTYELAVQDGYTGTLTQWLASLKPGAPAAGDPGADGNRNRWESYAPTTEAGLAGDAWYHVVSGAKIALYECYQAAGSSTTNAWRLRYTSPDAAAATVVATPGTGTGTGTASYPTQSAASKGQFLQSNGTAGQEVWATPQVIFTFQFLNLTTRYFPFFNATTIARIEKDAGLASLTYSVNGASPIEIVFTGDVWTGSISLPARATVTWTITYKSSANVANFELRCTETLTV